MDKTVLNYECLYTFTEMNHSIQRCLSADKQLGHVISKLKLPLRR